LNGDGLTRRGSSRLTAFTLEEAQPLIRDNVWPELKKLLTAAGAASHPGVWSVLRPRPLPGWMISTIIDARSGRI
jgi:hypothetical protein